MQTNKIRQIQTSEVHQFTDAVLTFSENKCKDKSCDKLNEFIIFLLSWHQIFGGNFLKLVYFDMHMTMLIYDPFDFKLMLDPKGFRITKLKGYELFEFKINGQHLMWGFRLLTSDSLLVFIMYLMPFLWLQTDSFFQTQIQIALIYM